MLKEFRSYARKVEKTIEKVNWVKLKEVRKLCKELDLQDMLARMTYEERIDYHSNLLNYKDNIFCNDIDIETDALIKQANLLAKFGVEDDVRAALSDIKCTTQDNLNRYRYRLLADRIEQPVTLKELIHCLWIRDFEQFHKSMQQLLLQAFELKELLRLIEKIDTEECFDSLEKLYQIHMKSPSLRLSELIEIICCTDEIVDCPGLEFVELDEALLDDEDLGSRMVHVADGIAYFIKKITGHDDMFNEDIIDCKWVLV